MNVPVNSIRPLIAVAAFSLCTFAFAQPNPYGCHYFQHGSAPHPTLTDAQRTQIDETIARSDTFDILHYDIALDVTQVSSLTITAATEITFKALMPNVNSIRFDLFELIVDSVLENGVVRSFTYDDQYLDVQFDTPPAVQEERTLTVHYHGVPHRDPDWGGFYFASGYVYNLGIGLSTIPPNFGKVWYPCFDSFVERATYTYHVKSAGTNRLHGQGTFIDEVQLGGDTVIRTYDLPQDIPTHISAVAVGNYAVESYTHMGVNGEIPVTLKAKPSNLASMVSKFGDLPSAIDACEYWYGPYAYDRVGYVHTTDGALEIPTNISYPDFMGTQTASENRDLYSHELGHHWWGDVITPYIHNEMWLKEGPAEYTGHLVAEWVGGQPALVKAVKDNLSFVLRQAHVNDGGYQALSPMPDAYIYGTHTYYKGAAVMHNLRGYLGDDVFRQAMRTIQANYASTTITSDGFKVALETVTGQDLDPFFDAWVFEPGYATFEVREFNTQPASGGWDVDVIIGQKLLATSAYHQQVPLDITCISATGEVFDDRVTVGDALTTVSLVVPFEPTMVVLNRYQRLNQNRLDHEERFGPGQFVPSTLPYVDFRLYNDTVVDTTLVRIEHIWAGPDQTPLSADVIAISKTHYWNVDGLWPEGTVLSSRLFYQGGVANGFDVDLVDGDESGIAVLFRPDPNAEWQVYPEQVVMAGSLTNGNGYMNLDNLRKGQYTFGKINGFVSVNETARDQEQFELYPVPANSAVTLKASLDGDHLLIMDVYDASGKRVKRSTAPMHNSIQQPIDVSGITEGAYNLKVITSLGVDLGTLPFVISR